MMFDSAELAVAELAQLVLAFSVQQAAVLMSPKRGTYTQRRAGHRSTGSVWSALGRRWKRPSFLQLTVSGLLRGFESAAKGRLVCREKCILRTLQLLLGCLPSLLHVEATAGPSARAAVAAAAGAAKRSRSAR